MWFNEDECITLLDLLRHEVQFGDGASPCFAQLVTQIGSMLDAVVCGAYDKGVAAEEGISTINECFIFNTGGHDWVSKTAVDRGLAAAQ